MCFKSRGLSPLSLNPTVVVSIYARKFASLLAEGCGPYHSTSTTEFHCSSNVLWMQVQFLFNTKCHFNIYFQIQSTSILTYISKDTCRPTWFHLHLTYISIMLHVHILTYTYNDTCISILTWTCNDICTFCTSYLHTPVMIHAAYIYLHAPLMIHVYLTHNYNVTNKKL